MINKKLSIETKEQALSLKSILPTTVIQFNHFMMLIKDSSLTSYWDKMKGTKITEILPDIYITIDNILEL